MPMVLDVFSTATTSIGGSNAAWGSQFAVMPRPSPPVATVTTYRPLGKWRRSGILAGSSVGTRNILRKPDWEPDKVSRIAAACLALLPLVSPCAALQLQAAKNIPQLEDSVRRGANDAELRDSLAG